VAQELAMPSGRDPVELATAYVEENGATLVACECDPETFSATVEVEVVIDGFLLVPGSKTVRAIAHAVVDLPSPAPTASSPSASPSA
jgi:hypothetical protein